MSEELKEAREFVRSLEVVFEISEIESLVRKIEARDKLIEAEVFHNALECLVDEIETGELLTPKLKAALAEHDREIERKARQPLIEALQHVLAIDHFTNLYSVKYGDKSIRTIIEEIARGTQ